MAAHLMWADRSYAQIDAELDAMASAGARWVRFDVGWHAFEPQQGEFKSYFVDRLDYIVAGARNRGIEPVVLVIGTPGWANGGAGQFVPPSDPQDISDFMYKLALTYKGRVTHFQVWNEPNHEYFWRPAPDATAYVALLRAAYAAAKAANPDCIVISGGLDGNDIAFLQQMYAAGATGHFDRLGLHSYCGDRSPFYPYQPYNSRWNFYGIPEMRATMDANGDAGKQMWVTEFGWQTSNVGEWPVTEAQQAQFVDEAYERLFQDFPYIEAMLVYDIRDDGTDPADHHLYYGLLRRDFRPKPAYYAFSGASERLWPIGRMWTARRVAAYGQSTAIGVSVPVEWGETSLTVQRLAPGTQRWDDLATGTATAQGSLQLSINPTATASYRATVADREMTRAMRVLVRAIASERASRAVARRRQIVRVYGRILLAPRRWVYLQRKIGRGRWRTIRRALSDSLGGYRFGVRHFRRGRYYYRAWIPNTELLLGTPSRAVRVICR